MSVISNANFGIYLKNNFDFTHILNNFESTFFYIYDSIKNNTNIPYNFDSILSDYPKYPENFKYISNPINYNQYKIYNVVTTDISYLLDEIDPGVLHIKLSLDDIPVEFENLKFDINFQKTFFEDTNSLYNKNVIFLENSNIQTYNNYIYYFIGNSLDWEAFKNIDCFHGFLNYYFSSQLVKDLFNYFENQFIDLCMSDNRLSTSLTSSDFNNYLNNNTNIITTDLAAILMKNNYGTLKYSEQVDNMVSDVIGENIDNLKTAFNNHINGYNYDVALELSSQISSFLTYPISNKLLQSLDYVGALTITTKIDKLISEYLSKSSENQLGPYLTLSFLYKNSPVKFLSILSLILRQYVEDKLITKNDMLFQNYEIKKLLTNFEIDTDDYYYRLLDNFDLVELKNTYNENNCSMFLIFLYFDKIIAGFLESEQYDEFVTNMLFDVFKTLNEFGLTTNQHNWFQNIQLIKLYFKSLLRKDLISGNLLVETKNIFDELIMSLFDQTFDNYNDVIAENLNGNKNTFKTKYQFDENTIQVFVDDVEISDYTDCFFHGKSHSISLDFYPEGKLSAHYQINYPIEFDITETKIKQTFNSFQTSDSIVSNTIDFYTNVILGTVTKQLLMDVLGHFKN